MNMTSLTVAQALGLSSQLKGDSARLEAEVLLAWVLKESRTWIYTWPEKTLDTEQQAAYLEAIERRAIGEPIAYIVGEKEFWSLPLTVNRSTLIPRSDTETLVEIALNFLKERDQAQANILDLGCGTGAVSFALASELPQANITAVDLVGGALDIALVNKERLQFNQVTLLQSDWYSALDPSAQFTVIVSNPPYIDADDPHLGQGDLRFEPVRALVSPKNGLADIQEIIVDAPAYLLPEGLLAIEHGWQQAEDVQLIFTACGFKNITTHRDLSGNCRVTTGQMG